MKPVPVLVVLALLSGCAAAGSDPAELSDADRQAIRALDSTYVAAWLRGDSAGVMRTLAPDAILLPSGRRPLVGADSIRAYWWPDDGSRTEILTFESAIDEIEGHGGTAWVRGVDSLVFTYARDTIRTTTTSLGMTLAVLTRDQSGEWRIARKMWGPMVR